MSSGELCACRTSPGGAASVQTQERRDQALPRSQDTLGFSPHRGQAGPRARGSQEPASTTPPPSQGWGRAGGGSARDLPRSSPRTRPAGRAPGQRPAPGVSRAPSALAGQRPHVLRDPHGDRLRPELGHRQQADGHGPPGGRAGPRVQGRGPAPLLQHGHRARPGAGPAARRPRLTYVTAGPWGGGAAARGQQGRQLQRDTGGRLARDRGAWGEAPGPGSSGAGLLLVPPLSHVHSRSQHVSRIDLKMGRVLTEPGRSAGVPCMAGSWVPAREARVPSLGTGTHVLIGDAQGQHPSQELAGRTLCFCAS